MIDRVANTQEGLLTEFLPTPPELAETDAVPYSDDAQNEEQRLREQANIDKYGFRNWYDWNIANWGTKWDFTLDDVKRVDENTVRASFESAWAPPIEAYRKLTELGFEVDALFDEPGMVFCGSYSSQDGENTIEYAGFTSENVVALVGEELDEAFGISERLADWEAEQDE